MAPDPTELSARPGGEGVKRKVLRHEVDPFENVAVVTAYGWEYEVAWRTRTIVASMYLADLLDGLPNPPAELEHLRSGVFADRIEDLVASRVSGRHNAVLGMGTSSLLHKIAVATCARGDVYVIHPSDSLLNLVMEGVLTEHDVNVDLRRAPLDRLPAVDGVFDTVFVLLQLHHEADPVGVLREVRRVLAPDGRLLIVETFHDGVSNSHAPPSDGASPPWTPVEEWLAWAGFLPVSKDFNKTGFTMKSGSDEGPFDVLLLEARAVNGDASSLRPSLPTPAEAQ